MLLVTVIIGPGPVVAAVAAATAAPTVVRCSVGQHGGGESGAGPALADDAGGSEAQSTPLSAPTTSFTTSTCVQIKIKKCIIIVIFKKSS